MVTLEEQVRSELLAVRKTAAGLTLATMSGCPTVTALLGGGDPGLAYNQLKARLLDEDYGIEILAAMASLGLTSDKNTHLGRLEDFGAEWVYDQRQVRRYSDKGIRQLAALVSTRWADRGTPELNLTMLAPAAEFAEIHVSARHLVAVEMRPVAARFRVNEVEQDVQLDFASHADDLQSVVWNTKEPLNLNLALGTTSFTLVWRGELWPKFAVAVDPGYSGAVMIETLGAKLMIRW